MRMMECAATTLLFALTIVNPVHATVLYDNLGSTDTTIHGDGVSSSGTFATTAPYGPLENSFSTGATTFDFKYLDLRLDRPDSPAASIDVNLLSDNATSPGSLIATLATLNDSAVSTSADIIQIPVASLMLAANTRYWIQLIGDGSDISWEWSKNTSGIGVVGEYFANQGGVFSTASGPYQMRVADTPVPEPASFTVFGVMLAGLGWRLRGRRNRAGAWRTGRMRDVQI